MDPLHPTEIYAYDYKKENTYINAEKNPFLKGFINKSCLDIN